MASALGLSPLVLITSEQDGLKRNAIPHISLALPRRASKHERGSSVRPPGHPEGTPPSLRFYPDQRESFVLGQGRDESSEGFKLTDEWAVSRRYMSLESLASLSDDPVLRLSAVAA